MDCQSTNVSGELAEVSGATDFFRCEGEEKDNVVVFKFSVHTSEDTVGFKVESWAVSIRSWIVAVGSAGIESFECLPWNTKAPFSFVLLVSLLFG